MKPTLVDRSPISIVGEISKGERLLFLGSFILLSLDLVFLQHGRIFTIDSPSFRQGIYAGLFFLFLLNGKNWKLELSPSTVGIAILGVGIPICWSIVGLVGGNRIGDTFNDANGHFYYLMYFPILCAVLILKNKINIINFFNNTVLVFSLICIVGYYMAATSIHIAIAIEVFLRENDYGFLNIFSDGKPYRLFLKSFPFVGVSFCYALHILINRQRHRLLTECINTVMLLATITVVAISQTRSLWVATFVGTLFVIYINRRCFGSKFYTTVFGLIFAILVLFTVTVDLATVRLDDGDGNVLYRIHQSRHLLDLLMKNPLYGSGFGSTVSMDIGRGIVTNFSFEMDIINMVRKLGFIGTAFWGLGFILVSWEAIKLHRAKPNSNEMVYFGCTLLIMMIMGFFNPYLTASLGIGGMVIAMVALQTGTRAQSL